MNKEQSVQVSDTTKHNSSNAACNKNIFIVCKVHGVSMPELEKAVRYYFYHQNPQKYQELSQKYFSFTSKY